MLGGMENREWQVRYIFGGEKKAYMFSYHSPTVETLGIGDIQLKRHTHTQKQTKSISKLGSNIRIQTQI